MLEKLVFFFLLRKKIFGLQRNTGHKDNYHTKLCQLMVDVPNSKLSKRICIEIMIYLLQKTMEKSCW
jgi:hypothetical protein